MERIFKPLLIAFCGLTVLSFGLAAIAANSKPNTDYVSLIAGVVLLLTGLTIFVCSGLFDSKKKKR